MNYGSQPRPQSPLVSVPGEQVVWCIALSFKKRYEMWSTRLMRLFNRYVYLRFEHVLEGLDGVNWQLTNKLKFNWQLTFVEGFTDNWQKILLP